MKLRSINLAFAMAFLFAWPTAVLSFSEVDRSFSQLVDLAAIVLVGTVKDASAEWGQGQLANSIFTVATLGDLDVIKGSAQGATYDFRYAGGRIGDLIHSYEGMPRLRIGTRYMLFISSDTNALFPTVGVSQGIFVVTRRGSGSKEIIQTVSERDVLGILDDRIHTIGTGEPVTFDQFVFCVEKHMLGGTPGVCQPEQPSPSGQFHPLDCSDHPSALVCYKFVDDQSVMAVWMDPGSFCVPHAGYDDTEQAARLRIGTKCHANSSGDLRFQWPRQTSQIWIQFRYKPQRELLMEPDAYSVPSYEVMVAWEGPDSCADVEFVQDNSGHRGYPQWSEACGAGEIRTGFPDGDFNLQPGGGTACHYQIPAERPPEKCLFYRSTWATVSYHMDLDGSGHGGQKWVDGWIQYDGGLRVHVLSFPLEFTSALEHAYFGPHMIGKDPSIDHPVWSVWYQDILITTRPLF